MRQFWSDASNLVIGPAPDSPAIRLAQAVATSHPSGVTSPIPVITTRRMCFSQKCDGPSPASEDEPDQYRPTRAAPAARWSSCKSRLALVFVDVLDRIRDGADLFGGIVRDFDPELFLEGHHQLDDVEAVRAQIVDEAGILGHLFGFDSQMLHDDLLHAIRSIAHQTALLEWSMNFDRRPNAPDTQWQVGCHGAGHRALCREPAHFHRPGARFMPSQRTPHGSIATSTPD